MHYKILIKLINQKFNNLTNSDKWDNIYFDTLGQTKLWNNLRNIKRDDVRIMLKFLNVWKCRIPKKRLSEICNKLSKTHDNFKHLKGKKLETVDFNQISKTVEEIFNSLKIKRVNATAISKIMHIINPDLFIMWDEKIREGCGFFGNSIGYINFLKKMQTEANEIIFSFCEENKVDKKEVIKRVNELCHNDNRHRYISKLLDEYNYTKFTRNL